MAERPRLLRGTMAAGKGATPFCGYSEERSQMVVGRGNPNIAHHEFLDTMSAFKRFKSAMRESKKEPAQRDDALAV